MSKAKQKNNTVRLCNAKQLPLYGAAGHARKATTTALSISLKDEKQKKSVRAIGSLTTTRATFKTPKCCKVHAHCISNSNPMIKAEIAIRRDCPQKRGVFEKEMLCAVSSEGRLTLKMQHSEFEPGSRFKR